MRAIEILHSSGGKPGLEDGVADLSPPLGKQLRVGDWRHWLATGKDIIEDYGASGPGLIATDGRGRSLEALLARTLAQPCRFARARPAPGLRLPRHPLPNTCEAPTAAATTELDDEHSFLNKHLLFFEWPARARATGRAADGMQNTSSLWALVMKALLVLNKHSAVAHEVGGHRKHA